MHPDRRGLPDGDDQPDQHRDPRQQNPPAPQPPHPVVEQRPRPLGVCPRPAIQELPQPRGHLGILEQPQPVGVTNLPGMLIGRHRPVGVALHARGVGDVELAGHVLHHRPRHIQRVLQEPADIAHRRRLQHQPEPVVLTPPILDQLPVDLIEDEEPLQISPRGHALKTSVPSDLRTGQKVQWHAPRTVALPPPQPATRRPTQLKPTPDRSSLALMAARIILDPLLQQQDRPREDPERGDALLETAPGRPRLADHDFRRTQGGGSGRTHGGGYDL